MTLISAFDLSLFLKAKKCIKDALLMQFREVRNERQKTGHNYRLRALMCNWLIALDGFFFLFHGFLVKFEREM